MSKTDKKLPSDAECSKEPLSDTEENAELKRQEEARKKLFKGLRGFPSSC